jgi:hypothetical protein
MGDLLATKFNGNLVHIPSFCIKLSGVGVLVIYGDIGVASSEIVSRVMGFG